MWPFRRLALLALAGACTSPAPRDLTAEEDTEVRARVETRMADARRRLHLTAEQEAMMTSALVQAERDLRAVKERYERDLQPPGAHRRMRGDAKVVFAQLEGKFASSFNPHQQHEWRTIVAEWQAEAIRGLKRR